MIRAVVVDDSALARKLVREMLESDPEIKVVGTAMNGIFALRRIYRDKPDVVTMDFEMPQMDGLEALKTIMERHPVPVVMLSAHTHKGAELTMKALELGAVDFVSKPDGRQSMVLGQLRDRLVEKVKAAARANVGKQSCGCGGSSEAPPATYPKAADSKSVGVVSGEVPLSANIDLIAIGASTGGVPGVSSILAALPEDAPPTLVVQHMPATFTDSFARRLDGLSSVRVKEADGATELARGMVLVARGNEHLSVRRRGGKLIARVSTGPKVSGHRPSVDYLFQSCLGVILTGMGKDGAVGLRAIHDAGGQTIAESEASCVVFGMPKEAIALGGAGMILPASKIPARILELVATRRVDGAAGRNTQGV
jgi:two-component system chemotaxis response regulator CheB